MDELPAWLAKRRAEELQRASAADDPGVCKYHMGKARAFADVQDQFFGVGS